MTRRVAAAALSAVLLVLAVMSGLSVTSTATSSLSSMPTAAATHTRAVVTGSERRPGAALVHQATDRQAPGWAPLDPPLADLPQKSWTPGEFTKPNLVNVAGLSIVTAGPALHRGRAPPTASAFSS